MTDSRKVLLTGASSGIGRSIAQRLLQHHHRVVGVCRRAEHVAFSGDYHPYGCDLGRLPQLPDELKKLARDFPDTDTVICCAGKGQFGNLEEFSYEQIRELIELNFISQAYVIRSFLPLMKRHGRGDIIIMGSEAALTGGQKGAIYCASKFALRGLAQSLREECAKSGVRVTIINPGMVRTEFFNELNFEPGADTDNYLLPEDVADAVELVLNSRPQTVYEEINLSPLKKVVQFRKP